MENTKRKVYGNKRSFRIVGKTMAGIMKKNKRIIVADFHQETNSFTPEVWTRERFEQDTCLHGQALLDDYGTTSGRTLSGILAVAKERHAHIFPACAVRATSGGPVEHAVVEEFISSLLTCYEANQPIDAFIMGLHGATQSTQCDDVCGEILSRIRSAVGDKVLVSIACDMHANITETCMENADYICGFQTYPHVDQLQTGIRAATLAFDRMENGGTDYLARAALPMIVPACGYTTEEGPFRDIIQKGHELVKQGKLKDFSIFQMQPWLDVSPAASTIIAISDEPLEAQKYADLLSHEVFMHRDDFWPQLYSMEEVIALAQTAPEGRPVLLVDFADSLGGGALGNSAAVLSFLKDNHYPVHTATILSDAKAVSRAEQVGIGREADFVLGAAGQGGMKPVHVRAMVRSLHDGVFYQKGPVGTGQRRYLGHVAVLSVNNVDVLVCEHACGTSDPEVYRAFGIEPTAYQMVVIKALMSFKAAFEEIAYAVCMTNTPGSCSADLKALPYTHLPRPFYPLDRLDGYQPEKPRIYCCRRRFLE